VQKGAPLSIGKNTKMGSEVFTPATAEKAILDLTQSGLSQRLFLIVKGVKERAGVWEAAHI
jgi:hypothetical protein